MYLPSLAARRPVATAVSCAIAQFLLTLLILLAGKAYLSPAVFGQVKLVAFASTIVFPLLLVHAFGWWRQVGFFSGELKPAPIFFVSLLLVAMNLSMGVHAREQGGLGGDLVIQFFNAFGEELLFRGVIFLILIRLPVWQAIVLNGVLFGSMHLLHGFMGASWEAAASQAALTALGGMMFTAIRYRTSTLWPVIVLHMAKNLSVMYSNLSTAGGPNAAMVAQAITVVFELALVAYVVWTAGREAPTPGSRPSAYT